MMMCIEDFKRRGHSSVSGVRIISIVLLGLPIVIISPQVSVQGFVTEENQYVVVRTRDSGTFVGIKEAITNVHIGTENKDTTHANVTTTDNLNPKVYYVFRGIPYAKPPIAELRFRDPEPPHVTAGPKDSTKFRPVCPQWDIIKGKAIGNPDCLYLNIFTPRLHFSTSRPHADNGSSPYDEDPRYTTRLLPTLVYVHGGEFISGSGNIINYQRFLDSNALVVSFNYRIGVFGFLSSGDSSLPGNYGILDQICALKWIKKNIHRFGGDANRVTIFGEVTPLLLSPLSASANIYEEVILMESPNSIFTPGLITSKPNEFYASYLTMIGCPLGGSEEATDCLTMKTSEDIIQAQQKFGQSGKLRLGPIIDSFPIRENIDAVFPVHPEQEIISRNFLERRVPLMFGVNNAEGFRLFQRFYLAHHLFNATLPIEENRIKNHLLHFLNPIIPSISPEAIDEIWKFYFSNYTEIMDTNHGAKEKFHLQMLNMFGDITVYNANWELLQTLAEKKTILYNYVFDHDMDQILCYLNNEAILVGDLGSLPWEEEFHLFTPEETEENTEDSIGDILINIWSSFAAYRTPKSALAKQKSWGKWFRLNVDFKDEVASYYHLKVNGSRMENNFRQKEATFWKETMSKVYEENKSPTSVTPRKATQDETKISVEKESQSNASAIRIPFRVILFVLYLLLCNKLGEIY